MPEWLEQNAWAVWLGLAFVLGVVEAATVDLVFLMLAGGALGGVVASLFTSSVPVQAVVAVVTALGLLGVVRPIAKRHLTRGNEVPMGTERYIGETVSVVEEVSDHSGLAKLDGETWTARVPDGADVIPTGAQARVTEISGASLMLTPVAPVRDIIHRGDHS